MRAVLTLEASRSDGTKYRIRLSLGVFIVGWLLKYFGL